MLLGEENVYPQPGALKECQYQTGRQQVEDSNRPHLRPKGYAYGGRGHGVWAIMAGGFLLNCGTEMHRELAGDERLAEGRGAVEARVKRWPDAAWLPARIPIPAGWGKANPNCW